MKKNFMYFGLLVLFLLLLYLFYQGYTGSQHRSNINYHEISQVLFLDDLPTLPTDWQIKTVEKYDDSFLSPHVIITYENTVSINLYISRVSFRDDWTHRNLTINGKNVDVYERKNQIAYVFRHVGLSYSIKATKDQKEVIESFILSL